MVVGWATGDAGTNHEPRLVGRRKWTGLRAAAKTSVTGKSSALLLMAGACS